MNKQRLGQELNRPASLETPLTCQCDQLLAIYLLGKTASRAIDACFAMGLIADCSKIEAHDC